MAINNTSKIIGLPDIAQLIEDDLNALSETLYDAGEIESEIEFNITADAQEYNIATTQQNSDGEDVKYTPGILEKINFDITSDPNMSLYDEVYSLQLYGYYSEMEDVRIIYDKYIIDQKGAYITLNGWLIKKQALGIDFAAPIDPDDGTGKDRFLSASTLLYSFLDGGIHATQTVFSIDSIRIPFYTLDMERNKTPKGGSFSSTDTLESRPNTQTLAFSIVFPLLSSNTKMVELAKDITEENYLSNNYTLTFTDGIVNLSYPVYLSGGKYELNQDGISTIKATFNIYRDGGIG